MSLLIDSKQQARQFVKLAGPVSAVTAARNRACRPAALAALALLALITLALAGCGSGGSRPAACRAATPAISAATRPTCRVIPSTTTVTPC